MGSTKKVGSTGRFKGRYGVGIKKRVLKVENKAKELGACSFCGFDKIKRVAAGLFVCRKCGAKFTGGAYEAQTLVGKAVNKMVSQKSFLQDAPVLIKVSEEKESSYSDIEKEVEEALNEGKGKKEKSKKKAAKKEVKKDFIEEENDVEEENEADKE